MIRETAATVLDVEAIGPFVRITLSCREIASQLTAGRFVMADLGSYLRTPLFPARLAPPEFDVMVVPAHPAAALSTGQQLELIGPHGRGFQIPSDSTNVLLIASTPYLPILLPLITQSAEARQSVALVLATMGTADLFPLGALPPSLEIRVVTEDNPVGRLQSTARALADLAEWTDCICIADEPATYPALAHALRESRLRPPHGLAQALVVPPIVCGTGACRGCAVAMKHGTKLACTDGPVFDLLDLE